jgi:hypothetical protein
MDDQDTDDLSPELRRAVEEARKETEPSPELEERMVQALRARGLILPPRGSQTRGFGMWVGLRIAATLVVFLGGVVVGYAFQSPKPSETDYEAGQTLWELAARVQETGSVHSRALEALAERAAEGSADDAALAREIALATIRAAVTRAILLDSPAGNLQEVLGQLREEGRTGWMTVEASSGQQVISF